MTQRKVGLAWVRGGAGKDGGEAGEFVREDLRGWALRRQVAVVETEDFGLEEERFVGVMGDGEHGYGTRGQVSAEAGQQVVPQGAVEAAEGFVEECQAGVRDGEGAREGDALAFTAGELVRAFGEEWLEVEEMDDFGNEGLVGRGVAKAFGEADVFGGGEVGEQGRSLGRVGELALLRRGAPERLPGGVRGGAIEGGGQVWNEAGEGTEDRALAAAGGAEENCPGCGQGGAKGQGELALPAFDGEAVMGFG